MFHLTWCTSGTSSPASLTTTISTSASMATSTPTVQVWWSKSLIRKCSLRATETHLPTAPKRNKTIFCLTWRMEWGILRNQLRERETSTRKTHLRKDKRAGTGIPQKNQKVKSTKKPLPLFLRKISKAIKDLPSILRQAKKQL